MAWKTIDLLAYSIGMLVKYKAIKKEGSVCV